KQQKIRENRRGPDFYWSDYTAMAACLVLSVVRTFELAHNPKVAGSNPAPATKSVTTLSFTNHNNSSSVVGHQPEGQNNII
ncbi:MAG: hypothetical protein V3V99_03055, partial [candidate division Zixibacteria bacterium]